MKQKIKEMSEAVSDSYRIYQTKIQEFSNFLKEVYNISGEVKHPCLTNLKVANFRFSLKELIYNSENHHYVEDTLDEYYRPCQYHYIILDDEFLLSFTEYKKKEL